MSSYDDIMGKRRAQQQEAEPDAPQTGMIDNGALEQRTAAQAARSPEDQEADAQAGGVYTPAGRQASGGRQASATVGDMGTAGKAQRYLTYDDIQQELKRQGEIMERNRPETKEEREKRERRERRNTMFAALGDGISALSNLYFTTKGAPNMYDPSSSLSEASRKRIELARQAREKEREAYNAAAKERYATLTDADSRAYKWETMARQKQQDADNKARKDALAEAQAGKYKAAQDKDEAMTAYYDTKVKAILEGLPLEKAEKLAKISKLNAEAGRASSGGSGSGGSGRGRKEYGTFIGKPYATEADYKKAVTDYALKENIPLKYNRQSSSKDPYGLESSGTTEAYRPIAEVAAEAEAHYRRTHAQQAASKPAQQPKQQPAQQKSSSKASAQKTRRQASNGKAYTGDLKWVNTTRK